MAVQEIEDSVELRTQAIGREVFARARDAESHHASFDQWLMRQGMNDELVKAQLFRFIDVLAVLKSPRAINQHFVEYLGSAKRHLSRWQRAAIDVWPGGGPAGWVLAESAKLAATRMAHRFIAAENLPGAIAVIQSLRKDGQGFTIDLLGEAVLSEAEADRYAKRYHDLIVGLTDNAAHWHHIALIDRDDRDVIPAVNVSIKLSSLFSQFDSLDPAATMRGVGERLRPILRLARSRGAFVNIDMEQHAHKNVTFQIFREIFAEDEFRDWPDVGIAMQAYLYDTEEDLKSLSDWARQRGTPVSVRLVKGAYWDFESVIAQQSGWPSPVFSAKARTDANYEKLTTFLMEQHQSLRPAVASHNIRSIAHAIATAESLSVPRGAFEFQMLFGMADPIKKSLTAMGHRVRVYTPFGDLLSGMAYLVRRLLENTSNESFLRAGFEKQLPEEQLLMNPLHQVARLFRPEPTKAATLTTEFSNEPTTDFSRPENREAIEAAVRLIEPSLGKSYGLMIDGRLIMRDRKIDSFNPSDRKQLIGRMSAATIEDATNAIAAAKEALPRWRDTPAPERAALLRRAATILRRRRFELAAWEVLEAGKPWREADADLAEAIDFCEFYAREVSPLAQPAMYEADPIKGNDPFILESGRIQVKGSFPFLLPGMVGEENVRVFEPRGVTVVIAPWNFPLAILCGMTTAALVTGNTVIMKPAEQTAVLGAKLMEVFVEAGCPAGVLNFLPGAGEEIGPALVAHPDVATIVFTGSRAVGLSIQKLAADTPPEQDHVKRVITEMGGKNAIIVDEDADLDEAIAGIVASAFGYAGQKCSACSRVIVLDSIYDAMVGRLVEATASLRIGPANDPSMTIPPVIDDEARTRIEKAIAQGKAQAKLLYGGDLHGMETAGSYVAPHIFGDVPADSSLAQEEIFGPVLAIIRAKDLPQAIDFANGTRYALTGGIYSRSPSNVDRVRRTFRVGNLYVNRKITGALVGRQPFGGFKLSGVGSQAGGSDYLQQFMLPRVITENTMRRGFVTDSNQE